jgi:glycosyltransferase involved in cell wall biosynthesis
MVRTAEAWSYHPDMARPWINAAVDAAIAVCKRKEISAIWATAGPVSSFYVARLASLKTEIPYVMDFRDAWTITHNEFEARRPLWATRRDRKEMYDLLRHAQGVTFRYDTEAECFWRAYRGALDASKVYLIPNGYEAPIEKYTVPQGERCIILYAGIVSDYRYDSLLTALNLLKQSDPERAKHLCLRFVGEEMDVIANEATALGLSDMIQTTGPKSYAEVASLQREAHALLVLGRPATKKGYELFAAAKLFGYLKAGRPIFGVLPEDETKKVLLRVGARTVADVNSTSDIVRMLRLVFDNWSSGTLSSLLPDPKACERYSSEKQAEVLMRALEGVAPEEPFLPGAQSIPPSLRDRIETRNDWMASRCSF